MARRSRGDGSVYYDAARGCWVGSVDVGRDPKTGRRRRRKVSAPSKTECRDKLDQLREEYRKAGSVGRRDVTVRQVVGAWLANLPESAGSANTAVTYRNAGNRIISGGRGVAGIGTVPVARLTAGDVERLLNGLARAGYSRSAIGLALMVLRRSLRRAQRDGLTSRNAAELADMPAGGKVRKSRAMTGDHVAALLALDLTQWWRAWIVTAIMTGLRPGELAGLRWADVDAAAAVIRVRQAVKREPGGLVVAGLKTPSSKRTLQMPAMVGAVLERQRKAQAAARLKAAAWADLDLVFARSDGRPPWPQDINRSLKRLCEQAGIGRDWQPRETRHTFVSALSDAGVDIERIADAVGHINSTVTSTVYRQSIADKVTEAAGVMDRLYPPESPK